MIQAQAGGIRHSCPRADEDVLVRCVDELQLPRAESTAPPRPAADHLPDDFTALLAGPTWSRRGAFVLGRHAQALRDFALSQAELLLVRRQPAAVERMRVSPVLPGRASWWNLSASEVDRHLARLERLPVAGGAPARVADVARVPAWPYAWNEAQMVQEAVRLLRAARDRLAAEPDREGLLVVWLPVAGSHAPSSFVVPHGTTVRYPAIDTPAADLAGAAVGPYDAAVPFVDGAEEHRRLADELHALARQQAAGPGPVLALRSQASWMHPPAAGAAAPTGPHEQGAIAFTPWGETVLLDDLTDVVTFIEQTRTRLQALPNGTSVWRDTRWTTTGSRWVPDCTGVVVAGGAEKEYTREPNYPTHIPRLARPYVEDSRARATAFGWASERRADGTPNRTPMDWVWTDCLLLHAFKNGTATKRLLPIDTVLYKFNAFPGLYRDDATAADFRGRTVSPWWSPWDGYAWGSSFANRTGSAPAPAIVAAVRRGRTRAAIAPGPGTPRPAAAANQRLTEPAPVLELGRLTSVVREDWSSLRYVIAIRLTQPVYAFFGDFASMERIGLEPDPPQGTTLPTPVLGQVAPGVPAKVGTSAVLQQFGDASAAERATRDLDVVRTPDGRLRGMELPGGSTQFYIPNLTAASFVHKSLAVRASDGVPAVRGSHPDPATPEFDVLDLGGS